MDPVTHVAVGALLSQVIPNPLPVWKVVAGMAFSLLPDSDYFFLFSNRLAHIRHHRAFSHSLIAQPLFALLGAGLAWLLGGPRWFLPIFFLGLAVLATHILILDLATSYGTQLLYPFSRKRYAVDCLFIVDPYLTGLLLAGAVVVPFPGWGLWAGRGFLAAAGLYVFLCVGYHRQALALARRVFLASAAGEARGPGIFSLGQAGPPAAGALKVAAIPQPFSCRRWLLLAASGREVAQAFVQLPFLAVLGLWRGPASPAAARLSSNPGCRTPGKAYRAPQDLQFRVWSGLPLPEMDLAPEALEVRDRYLEFARFPLLHRVQTQGDGLVLEWLDLRFSVPGRNLPFALQMGLETDGRLRDWRIGLCGNGFDSGERSRAGGAGG